MKVFSLKSIFVVVFKTDVIANDETPTERQQLASSEILKINICNLRRPKLHIVKIPTQHQWVGPLLYLWRLLPITKPLTYLKSNWTTFDPTHTYFFLIHFQMIWPYLPTQKISYLHFAIFENQVKFLVFFILHWKVHQKVGHGKKSVHFTKHLLIVVSTKLNLLNITLKIW